MIFEVIEKNSEKWSEVVKNAEIYDFHHTNYFHQIDTELDCKLLHCYKGDSFIALPVVIRPIEGTEWFDITSVYGYAGPVSKLDGDETQLIEFFQESFKSYCLDNKIVSAFARLHPLIEQKNILDGLGETLDLNRTVSIDLTITPAEQWRVFRKSNKPAINKLRREGMSVKVAETKEEVDRFVDIYYETMDRVDAAESYYFSREYFHSFLDNPDFGAKILLAIKDDKVAAGSIFTFTDKIMQYHLAGTSEEFLRAAPMMVILDEARLIGNETSATDLHLGGGVGGSDDDSLFRFKSGFSKNLKQFSVWRYIANQEVYDELSKDKDPSGFFPLYRS